MEKTGRGKVEIKEEEEDMEKETMNTQRSMDIELYI